ncbi:MAG TPA: hypothetical protein VFI25_07500 [Planctomycetota bacterium]|nr:hypothetical protein [Planctomycetota bacterium]
MEPTPLPIAQATPVPPPPRYGSLRLSLLAGAAYDAAVGLWTLLDLQRMGMVLGAGELREPYALRFCGLLLVGLGLFYFVAALELSRSLRSAAAAIAIRSFGGVYVIAHTLAGGVPKVFLAFGCVDLVFGILHYGFLRRGVRRGFVGALLRG